MLKSNSNTMRPGIVVIISAINKTGGSNPGICFGQSIIQRLLVEAPLFLFQRKLVS